MYYTIYTQIPTLPVVALWKVPENANFKRYTLYTAEYYVSTCLHGIVFNRKPTRLGVLEYRDRENNAFFHIGSLRMSVNELSFHPSNLRRTEQNNVSSRARHACVCCPRIIRHTRRNGIIILSVRRIRNR